MDNKKKIINQHIVINDMNIHFRNSPRFRAQCEKDKSINLGMRSEVSIFW